MTKAKLSPAVLDLDLEKEADRIAEGIRDIVFNKLKKKGAIVAVSGGIDSSTVLGLCVRALGKKRVFGILMPEQDSSPDTMAISKGVVEVHGVDYATEIITDMLNASGCYTRRDAAIREVIPEYTSEWKSKIVFPSVLESADFRIFKIVAQDPSGKIIEKRLRPASYLTIVAASNFKQRTRKMIEYFHGDRLNYAVSGTPNRLEYDQGFFVKGGDGLADFKPIAHLYKSQVYAMAAVVGVPENVRSRAPTTDTYSMPQGQDEFYFSLSYDKMDLALYALNHGYTAAELAEALGITEAQAQAVYRDIESKRKTTAYLHRPPVLVDAVSEIHL